MKSYEEIDLKDKELFSTSAILVMAIMVLVLFIFHLLFRHNALDDKYRGCMDTVRLYSNAWEQTR